MKEVVAKILKKSKLIKLKEKELVKFIEIPRNLEFGDFSFPCFVLARALKMNPNDLALEIRQELGNPPQGFEAIETQGPYINFYLDKKQNSINLLSEILSKKDKFGPLNIGQGKKALVEHTSINPNASPHVGRIRNAIIGDSIVKILKFMNFKTETHYYVNDVSKQIAMLVLAKADKLKFQSMLKKYTQISKKVEKSKKLEQEVFNLLNEFESNKKETVAQFKKITRTCVDGQADILSELGIKYDVFDYESDYIKKSKKILESLKQTKKLHKDKEGRLYLDQKSTQVKNKMKSPVLVLTRSDGTGLYPLRDLAYTIDKVKNSKKNIIVLGEDQKLYFLQLTEALKLLMHEAPEVVHYSFVLIGKKGKSKKMSTRKGDVILLEDFLKDAMQRAKREISKRKTKGDAKKIAVGAVKYSILKNNPNKVIMFDLQEALNFEGDTGPYLLYSYARASSIIRKFKHGKKQNSFEELHEKEIALVKKLSKFQEIVLQSYASLNPSHLTNYSYSLAKSFNEFYHECPVLNSENENFRISLVEAFRQVLKNALSLLGIETLEEM